VGFGERPKSGNWVSFPHCIAGFLISAKWVTLARSAAIYTVLGSCRRHEINPFDYLKDLFTRLPAAWAKAKASGKVVAQAA